MPPSDPDAGAATRLRAARRRRRLAQEIAVRVSCALVIVLVIELMPPAPAAAEVRTLALLGVALNLPYWFLAQTGRALRLQAYARMLIDIGLITAGLSRAGGLAAAAYLGVYVVVPLYAGLAFSSVACLVATGTATAAFLAVALLQQAGALAPAAPPPSTGWRVAAFNLAMLDLVGVLTAVLAEAYRRSRLRLAEMNRELERAHDRSLRLNAEIQRAARLRVLGEVVAGIAHELGNVLTVAAGHLALAREKAAGRAPEADAHLAQVEESFTTAIRIIRSTLDTARQPAGATTAVSLGDIARQIVELKGYDLRRDRITVRLDFPAELPPVRAAPYQVQQVLLNLVTNAQDALRTVPPPRLVEIAGRCDGAHVIVEVSDTGPGIPPEALPRLFEPFYTTKPQGIGLGLAISAEIARGLGGALGAENRSGRGAVFRLQLPAIGAEAAPGGAAGADLPPAGDPVPPGPR